MLTINLKKLQLEQGDSLLDVGCGEGRHVIHACLEYNVLGIGVDLSLRDLHIANERFAPFANYNTNCHFSLQQTDATHLPFADNSFDKIICSEVLEHIENYIGVLQEIKRVLKPNGILGVSVPRAWPEKICWKLSDEYHQVEGGHIRIFDAQRLRKDIEALGFTFTHRYWAHALHSPFWWLKCLWWKSQDSSRIIKMYHRLLVWDLMQKPWITQTLEKILNPVLGKSVVMHFKKRDIYGFESPKVSGKLLTQRLRNRIMEVLSIYADDECWTHLGTDEVINQWGDFVDDVRIPLYVEPVFSTNERENLLAFHNLWVEFCDNTPQILPPLETLKKTIEWKQLQTEAIDLLAVFNLRGKFDEDVEID